MPSPDARRKAGPLAPGGICPVNPGGCRQQDVRPQPGPSTRAASSTSVRPRARLEFGRRLSPPRPLDGGVSQAPMRPKPGRRPDALSVQATIDAPAGQRVAGRPSPSGVPAVWLSPGGRPSRPAQTTVRTPDKGRRVVRQADRQGRPHLKGRAVGSICAPRIGGWLALQTHSSPTRRATNRPSRPIQTHGLATRRATNRPSLALQTHDSHDEAIGQQALACSFHTRLAYEMTVPRPGDGLSEWPKRCEKTAEVGPKHAAGVSLRKLEPLLAPLRIDGIVRLEGVESVRLEGLDPFEIRCEVA